MSDDVKKEPTPASLRLGDVWLARDAWAALIVLRMKHRIRYKLTKYYKGVAEDIAAIGVKHNEIINRVGKPDAGGRVSVKSGTPEHAEYIKEFSEYLNQDSELKRAPFDMDALDDGIDVEGNAISANDLLLLEPFFNQKGAEEETG